MTARWWIVGGALFLAFNLNFRAIGSRDTHLTEYVALSLSAKGDANLDEYAALVEGGVERGYLTRSPDGHILANYPIVAALAAVPAYWLVTKSGWIDPDAPVRARVEATGKIVASAYTALACALLWASIRRVSFTLQSRGVAVATWVAVAVALGTPLWTAASQALWAHAAAAAALAAAFWASGAGRATEFDRDRVGGPASRQLRAGAVGAAYGFAVACRPLLVVFLAGAVIDRLRRKDLTVVGLVGGAATVLLAVALYNFLAYGTLAGGVSVLESAATHQRTHLVDGAWSMPLAGLAGVLVSPSRGLLVYCPVVLIAAVGAFRARQDRVLMWLVTLPVCAFIAGWSSYSVWWGGHTYGPRYASDIAIPLGLVIARGWTVDASRVWSLMRNSLVAWSVAVQAIGAACYPGGSWNVVPADVDHAHARLWDWSDSQILRTMKAGIYRRSGRLTPE